EVNPPSWSNPTGGFSLFSKDIKLACITDVNNGLPIVQAMKKYDIRGTATIYQWMYAYQRFGVDGLIPFRNGRTIHDYSFKIMVITWRIDNSESYPSTAKHFDIKAPATIWQWEKSLISGRLKPQIGRFDIMSENNKDRKLKELEAENERLRVKVAYLEKLKALTQKNPKSPTNKKHR
ncbi:hypothetical protein, partial [Companilactobacillus halodurans]|uniref:helix-turn-helix domain-containing protein n=1 Tax=Companilactobacillus halodurans TaxID=2584183 RepID=UPI00307DF859